MLFCRSKLRHFGNEVNLGRTSEEFQFSYDDKDGRHCIEYGILTD